MKTILQLIPTITWLASLLGVIWFPVVGVYIVIASTLNLIHARWTTYHSGTEFSRRVHETLSDDIKAWELRLVALEKTLDDVKDAQVKIGGAFVRGRPQ